MGCNSAEMPLNGNYETAIAIVGMSGRFPGAQDVHALWNIVAAGVRSIRDFSDDELRLAGLNPSDLGACVWVRAGTLLAGVEHFDATFFGYAPREAETIDPQHRLLLEHAWSALEDAGLSVEDCCGRIGIFAGSGPPSYKSNHILVHPNVMKSASRLQISMGNDKDSLASTISYKLNLKGPSVSVQTFCSTSLVAVHLACQSLLTYECDVALAGGVAVQVPQGRGYEYQEGGILSPDGHCRTFDVRAGGSVMGSGVGLVVLRRLEDALREGDQVYAVILGSAVNNDGGMRAGYTAPAVDGQAAVIREALSHAEVDAETIGYVEAHGTATPLGDAVELAAMIKAFGGQARKGTCAIGSIKPNVGHLDRAAGVTGLIKTVQALRHKQLPPQIDFERANPDIDLENSPFYVNTTAREWQRRGTPRRAGVSSFGLGGTNAHVVLEEAPEREASSPARPWELLVVSAKTSAALEEVTTRLADHLAQDRTVNLGDVAYTLQVGRCAFNHRRIVVCRDAEDASAALSARDPERVFTVEQVRRGRQVAFMFPGLGDQYVGMARDLFRVEPAFRAAIDECATVVQHHFGSDAEFYQWVAGPSTGPAAPRVALPALFAVEYALARLLMAWGIRPRALLGCSMGEYVAATVGGVLSLEEGLRLCCEIARALDTVPPGAMLTADLAPQTPTIPIVSSAEGGWLVPERARDPQFWSRLICREVRFREASRELLADENLAIVELGPGPVLASFIGQHADCVVERVVVAALPHSQARRSDASALLEMVGRLWLDGVGIEWKAHHAGRRTRRSLPSYPFEPQRHWLEPKQGRWEFKPSNGEEARAPIRLDEIADWLSQPIWVRQPLPIAIDRARLQQKSPWMVITGELAIGKQLVSALRAHQCPTVLVAAGPAYERRTATDYILRLAHLEDWHCLFGTLDAAPRTIVHLGGACADAEAPLEGVLEAGFYSVLALAQAIEQRLVSDEVELWLVSANAVSVLGGDGWSFAGAALLGAARVIPQEILTVRCSHVDLIIENSIESTRQVTGQLLMEMAQPAPEQPVALRAGERWLRRIEPLLMPLPEGHSVALRSTGAYMLVGGFGAVAAAIARYLAKTLQARLVLLARTELPPPESWETWLTHHPPEDRTSRRIRHVQGLEALGAEVLCVAADVTDERRMQAAFSEARARFGALHGVFYAAGSSTPAAFQTIRRMGRAECELHFGPKLRALPVLERVLAADPVEFVMLFSSLAAVLGGLGFIAYAAANSAMDSFAAARKRGCTTSWITVNWDTWRLHERRQGDLGRTIADLEMSADEGMEVIERILIYQPPHVIVSTGNLETRFRQWVRMSDFRADDREFLHPRPQLGTPYSVPQSELEKTLCHIWQQVLGIERVGIHDDFLELGGHSLLATQLIGRIRKAFRLDIPLTALFDAPSVSRFAEVVEQEIIEEIEALSEDEAARLDTLE